MSDEQVPRHAPATPNLPAAGLRAQHSASGARLAAFRTAFWDFLFPPRCVVCRTRGAWLCAQCQPLLALIRPPICLRCGLPVELGANCEWCRHENTGLDARRVGGYFDGPLRDAIHRLKFAGERYLARPLAEVLATAWLVAPSPVDVLVPVPLGIERERQRGYNQSALLAREAGRLLGLPVAERALVRSRETPPQVGLPREARLVNLHGAFAADETAVAGRSPLLIDDVSTTGATLTACAAALRAAGARSVSALVLAKTR